MLFWRLSKKEKVSKDGRGRAKAGCLRLIFTGRERSGGIRGTGREIPPTLWIRVREQRINGPRANTLHGSIGKVCTAKSGEEKLNQNPPQPLANLLLSESAETIWIHP